MAIKFANCICCGLDLTTATRIISFIGLTISALLLTILLSDKFINDYDKSRKTALVFGLDWQHFHPQINASHHADPEGKMISIIVMFYSVIFLLINTVLLFGSIMFSRWCCIPWLVCELLGCVSKLGALIFHLCTEPNNLSNIFVAGSVVYVVVTIWWWFVVLKAQQTWKPRRGPQNNSTPTYGVHYCNLRSSTVVTPATLVGAQRESVVNITQTESPGPYRPNQCYSMI